MNRASFTSAKGYKNSYVSLKKVFSSITYLKSWAVLTSFFSIIPLPTLTIAFCISFAMSIPCINKCMLFCLRSRASYATQKLSNRHSATFVIFIPRSFFCYAWLPLNCMRLGFLFSSSSCWALDWEKGLSRREVIANAQSVADNCWLGLNYREYDSMKISLRPKTSVFASILALRLFLISGSMNAHCCFAYSTGQPISIKNWRSLFWPGSLLRAILATM